MWQLDRFRPVPLDGIALARAILAASILVVAVVAGPALAEGEVGAIGRLAPRGGIITLTGTPGTSIQKILVEPHQTVRRGDVLIVLSSHDLLEAEHQLAGAELEALGALGQLKTRQRNATLKAARLTPAHAKRGLSEYQALGAGATSKAELARRRNAVEIAQSEMTLASLGLERLKRELSLDRVKAETRRKSSEARYRSSMVVAPTDGTVLAISKQEGEHLSGDPVILMANTSEMYVVCQVFEGDLSKIEEGMRATATSNALPAPLEGTVKRVDRIIDTDRKLAKVLIKLDSGASAERLIGMEVQVTIHL